MGALSIFFLVVFVISSVILILVIMLQDEQGDSLGGLLGGGSSSAFGSQSGNVLTRFTTLMGVIFITFSLALALSNRSSDVEDLDIQYQRQQLEDGQPWYKSETPETDQSAPALPLSEIETTESQAAPLPPSE